MANAFGVSMAAPLAAALLLASSAFAQDLRPLSDVMGTAAKPYPFTRCAGMYLALTEWTGRKRMGDATYESLAATIEALLTASAVISLEDNLDGGPEHASSIAMRDTRNVADLYLARFERNYAEAGEAFASDPIVASDVGVCREIANATLAAGFGGAKK